MSEKSTKKKHRHKFVPIEILWRSVWGRLDRGKSPQPLFVALACGCGAVKLVPAKVVYGGRLVLQQYKKMTR